ncbi:MAG: hypothetical protein NTY19_03770, partial [Planctomycetota bacterium]|nr:hypothetical protein [Planctomycetota bacterium]
GRTQSPRHSAKAHDELQRPDLATSRRAMKEEALLRGCAAFLARDWNAAVAVRSAVFANLPS